MKRCHKCGKPWISDAERPKVKAYCEACSAYLHCCLNCRFYDERAHNKCVIPTTDWVGDRAGPNFCGDFEFADTETGAADGAQERARTVFKDLFQAVQDNTADKSPSDFEKLFGG